MDYYAFCERLRTLRLDKGITQDVLCRYLGTSKSAVSKYENGLSTPSYDVLIGYARYFKISTDYLLGLQKDIKVSVTDLTENQIRSIQGIIVEFHRANHAAH